MKWTVWFLFTTQSWLILQRSDLLRVMILSLHRWLIIILAAKTGWSFQVFPHFFPQRSTEVNIPVIRTQELNLTTLLKLMKEGSQKVHLPSPKTCPPSSSWGDIQTSHSRLFLPPSSSTHPSATRPVRVFFLNISLDLSNPSITPASALVNTDFSPRFWFSSRPYLQVNSLLTSLHRVFSTCFPGDCGF